MKQNIRYAIEDGIACIKAYKPFLKQTEYEKYSKVIEKDEIFQEHNDQLTLAIGRDKLSQATNQILRAIEQSFDELRDFTSHYDNFIKVYQKTQSFNVQDAKNMDQETISQILYDLKKELDDTEKMDVKSTVRIYKIEGDMLKSRIKESQQECQSQLRNFIPKIQFDRFQEIYVSLNKDYQKVAIRPRKIDDYVALMNNLRELTERMDTYSTNFHETERIGLLMEEHRIKFPERNRNKLKETQSLLIETKRAMVVAFESSQQHKLVFKKELMEIEIPLVQKKIEELKAQLSQDGLFDSLSTNIDEAVKRLDTIGEQVKKTKERGLQLNQFQKFLDLDETAFEASNEVHEDWQVKHKLWYGMKIWTELSKQWLITCFTDINVEEITNKVEKFSKMANFCCVRLKKNKMAVLFKEQVDFLRITMPIVTYLRDEALQEKHWEEIFETLKMSLDLNDQSFTLNSLIELNVQDHKGKLEEIALKANQERELETSMEKLIIEWKKAFFETKQHKDSYFIMVPTEQLNTLLEESLAQLSKMLAARFVERVRAEAEILYRKLQFLENLMNEWLTFQRTWIYLENIFNSSDIAIKMGQDSKRFFQLDHIWKEIMKQTNGNPLVLRAIAGYNQIFNESVNIMLTQSPYLNYLEIFKQYNRTLEDIQRSLEVLLEKKRSDFPRFYFLSNDELLQILSKGSKDPISVQHHLKKLFENVSTITVDMDDIVLVNSAEGESIKFRRVKAVGVPVEKWLNSLNDGMVQSVRKSIKEAHSSFREDHEDFKREDWVLDDHTAQSICLVGSVIWCGMTEQLLKQSQSDEETLEELDWWLSENISQLQELTQIISRTDISSKKRRCLVALITQDVHCRDVVDLLMKESLQRSVSIYDFIWQQQLRYYVINDEVTIRQVNASFDYGYEYLGATSRIVITPLTDRCWITITGALHLKLGAAPSGPAGTGKTESTKDLAKALGKYCIVFNCSDQVNYKMMELLFLGLSLTGSWVCLDEFNRINIEVLSVIAQQLQAIRGALLSGKTSDIMLGDKKLDKFVRTLGIFITMNPGYKGRAELPDNLKVLFRPISMMIPDYALIAEIMLFSEGFHQAKLLSRKMAKLYKLASEQLSHQVHYDFGMRAVKSVLVMAGQVKRSNTSYSEEEILIKAIIDSNVPKFIKEDLTLFNAIIQDLFPNLLVQLQHNPEFKATIESATQTLAYTPSENQTNKIIQLHETMMVRFGIMVIGNTMTGKSAIIKSLKEALNTMGTGGAECEILNPKSINLSELYGNFSHSTQEWTDGLCSLIIRRYVESDSTKMKWVIFDGPVDSIWIENMNTVLDDNQTLCLSNGERIKLRSEMRMIFEIDNLQQASPATVSRCGMVYTCEGSLNWRQIAKSWLQTLDKEIFPEDIQDNIWNLLEAHLDKTIELIRTKRYKEAIPMPDNNFVISLCRIFQGILQTQIELKNFEKARQRKVLTKVFMYALAWSFGGSIDSHHHSSFEVYLGNSFSDMPTTSIFDNCLIIKGTNTADNIVDFQLWSKTLSSTYDYQLRSSDILIQTKDTQRYQWLIETQLRFRNPVFITGHTGVGKTMIINAALQSMKKSHDSQLVSISFSSQTGSQDTQVRIEEKLEKKRRTLLGGHNGHKVLIHIDDVSMPSYDQHGTQSSIELLRQFLDYQGFYDREGLFWKSIQDCTLICSAASPEGGRKVMTQRFTRHFHMLNMPITQEDSLQKIFGTILSKHFASTNGFKKEIVQTISKILDSTLSIYFKIVENLRPTPSKQHYSFNLRDISRVISGLCKAHSSTLSTNDIFNKLWIHESSRVFLDRLMTESDKLWFQNLIVSTLKHHMRYQTTREGIFEKNKTVFCDFLQRGLPYEERYYQFCSDFQKVSQSVSEYIDEYNITNASTQMNLVLFDQFIDHVSRLCRILSQERSNALLVGMSGSGKQSVIRLASFMSHCKLAQIQARSKVTAADIRDSFKKSLIDCGVHNKRITFMIIDSQLSTKGNDDLLMEDINNLLNFGEIPNLWNNDERELILKSLKGEAQERGIFEDVIGTLFVEKTKKNLHLIICMSPIGDSFRNRIRMFPSLINCCQIDWFEQWPNEALLQVSQKFIDSNQFNESAEVKSKLSQFSVRLHNQVEFESEEFFNCLGRRVYVTPSIFLDLFRNYIYQIEQKQSKLSIRKRILTTGCDKMRRANEMVAKLTSNMLEMQPELEQSAVDIDELSIQLERDRIEASKSKSKVEQEKKAVDKQTTEVQYQYNQALEELNRVLPVLQEAVGALDTLNQSDITELRGTKFPSKGILNTMTVTLMLLENKQDYRKIEWKMCQQMMSVGFFEKLKSFEKEELIRNEKLAKSVESFIFENPEFTPDIVKNASRACYSLCKWCYALLNYANISKQVAPKQQLVEQMEIQLKKAQSELGSKQSKLTYEMKKVEQLEHQYQEVKRKRESLFNEIELCKVRIIRSKQLVNGLGGEGVRWEQAIQELEKQQQFVTAQVLMSSAAVTYFGPFSGIYRTRIYDFITKDLRDLGIQVNVEHSTLESVIGDPMLAQNWKLQGLPSDSVSIVSAVIVTSSLKSAFMIDPQQQAVKWLTNMYMSNEKGKGYLKIVRLNQKDFVPLVEGCIKTGNSLMIEDVENNLDPILDPLLLKLAFRSQHGRLQIQFSGQLIDYDQKFKLYLATRNPNPHLLPEIFMKVSIINFTVTPEGLQEQLLADIVRLENPELENQRIDLTRAIVKDNQKIVKLQDDILLQLVNSSEYTILDDEDLINYLQRSKQMGENIIKTIEDNTKAQIDILKQRAFYVNIAERGSIIYFTILDLAKLNIMYQNSLEFFKALFLSIIEKSPQNEYLERRIALLLREITKTIYLNVSRGLFNEHKLLFAFMLAVRINLSDQSLAQEEWNIFLRGSSFIPTIVETKNPNLIVYLDKEWKQLCLLQQSHQFMSGILKSFENDVLQWMEWKNSTDLWPLPGEWETRLTQFQKLMIVKILRTQNLQEQLRIYVRHELGHEFSTPHLSNLEEVLEYSDRLRPILLIVETGADPTTSLLRLYTKVRKQEDDQSQYTIVSLGQGQDRYALSCIEKGIKKGLWVILQNCHLFESFMPQLERVISQLSFKSKDIHKDFRLFLTSSPCKFIPVSILQQSDKVTYEQAKGIKSNLLMSLHTLMEQGTYLEENKEQDTQYKVLTYSLCMFHAIVQERRKFGPLGWNISYEFNESDLDTAQSILSEMLNDQTVYGEEFVKWDSLREMLGEIVYGGRVTDEQDRRTLKTVLRTYICHDVLKSDYSYTQSGIFRPPFGKLLTTQDLIDHAQFLPEVDIPDIFGMNDNADLSCHLQSSSKIIENIHQMQPKILMAQGKAGISESQIEAIANTIIEQLPQELTREGANRELFQLSKDGLLPSMTVFLLHEIERFNKLLFVVTSSLETLKKAMNGQAIINEDVDRTCKALTINKVPKSWCDAAYPSLKPLSSWIINLRERFEFMRNWISKGKPGAYWLSAYFFPQGFLTSVLQNYSRKSKIAIDTLTFKTELVSKLDISELEHIDFMRPACEGVLIYGLFLESGYINSHSMLLEDSQLNVKLQFNKAPMILFRPMEEENKQGKASDLVYQCPIYKTSERAGTLSTTGHSTNFIISVDIPSNLPSRYWILRSTAMLCQTDD